jgi:hypothetical protein
MLGISRTSACKSIGSIECISCKGQRRATYGVELSTHTKPEVLKKEARRVGVGVGQNKKFEKQMPAAQERVVRKESYA